MSESKKPTRGITRKRLEKNFNYILTGEEFRKYIQHLPNYSELLDVLVEIYLKSSEKRPVVTKREEKENLVKNMKSKSIKDAKTKILLTIFIQSIIGDMAEFPSPIKILIPSSKKHGTLLSMKKDSIYIPVKIEGAFTNLNKIRLSYEHNNIVGFFKKNKEYTIIYYSALNNLEISKYLHDTLDPSIDDTLELINYASGNTTYSYMDIYSQCMEYADTIKICNIIFLIADISVSKTDPSPLIISETFKKSKKTYGFRVSINKTRTSLQYNHLLFLNKTVRNTKNIFKINFNLKLLNNQLLDLLKFNIRKQQQLKVEDATRGAEGTDGLVTNTAVTIVTSVSRPEAEELKIHITNNSIFSETEFILGPDKRRRTIKDARILSDIMYKDVSGNIVVLGEFRGPLKTDETDDSEKNCKIIWNKDGNRLLSDLSDKL